MTARVALTFRFALRQTCRGSPDNFYSAGTRGSPYVLLWRLEAEFVVKDGAVFACRAM